jgi:hypothetical protein
MMARAATGGKDRDGVAGGRGGAWQDGAHCGGAGASGHERCLPPTSRGLCGPRSVLREGVHGVV